MFCQTMVCSESRGELFGYRDLWAAESTFNLRLPHQPAFYLTPPALKLSVLGT